jgi:D-alanine-D-alanine ligase-like ATP-grasp enzyme
MQDILESIQKYDHTTIENKIATLDKELDILNKEREEYEKKKSQEIIDTIRTFIDRYEKNIVNQVDRIDKLTHNIEQNKIKINKFKILEKELNILIHDNKLKKINGYLLCLQNINKR